MSPSARELRKRIAEQAHHRCGYCLTLEAVSGIPLTLEHIIPKAKGGQDVEENLKFPLSIVPSIDLRLAKVMP